MKELLENSGYSEATTGSPRAILKTAYKAGMINYEKLCFASSQRNLDSSLILSGRICSTYSLISLEPIFSYINLSQHKHFM